MSKRHVVITHCSNLKLALTLQNLLETEASGVRVHHSTDPWTDQLLCRGTWSDYKLLNGLQKLSAWLAVFHRYIL